MVSLSLVKFRNGEVRGRLQHGAGGFHAYRGRLLMNWEERLGEGYGFTQFEMNNNVVNLGGRTRMGYEREEIVAIGELAFGLGFEYRINPSGNQAALAVDHTWWSRVVVRNECMSASERIDDAKDRVNIEAFTHVIVGTETESSCPARQFPGRVSGILATLSTMSEWSTRWQCHDTIAIAACEECSSTDVWVAHACNSKLIDFHLLCIRDPPTDI